DLNKTTPEAPEKTKKIKVKKNASSTPEKEQKHSRVMEILKKEYAFENWLLAILSPVLILYGVYILIGKFGSVNLVNVLGSSGIGFIDFFFNTPLKRILTGVFLVLIGLLVIIYLAIPFLRPSIAEMKKVSWPTSKSLAINTSRVFLFLVLLMVVFTLYGFLLEPLFSWLFSL
ncbi:MAG: preprotein translocase subunit SecE, partial [Candidatus Izemoplasmatales bacterium]|nr:preprotein translocase subunit SecE [Candidatus Izemoplasmatales bacterium]